MVTCDMLHMCANVQKLCAIRVGLKSLKTRIEFGAPVYIAALNILANC
jgi:hypothetical protein